MKTGNSDTETDTHIEGERQVRVKAEIGVMLL